ncbi:MAG: DUF2845 domain-containing protein [Rubrivivax sp.]|nr:DUF2845 domain-containing protein [Rubrivivax sp.]
MLSLHILLLSAATALLALPAQAEPLACAGGTVSEGDSRLSLIYKCGPPVLTDADCSPMYQVGTLQRVPDWLAVPVVPYSVIERLLYERGQGNLLAVVHMRSGVIRSISYSRQPR